MSVPNFEIKYQSSFTPELEQIIPHSELRDDFLKTLRFTLRHFPEQGIKTRRAQPFQVYAWRFKSDSRVPAVIVYYCFENNIVLVLSVKRTQDAER